MLETPRQRKSRLQRERRAGLSEEEKQAAKVVANQRLRERWARLTPDQKKHHNKPRDAARRAAAVKKMESLSPEERQQREAIAARVAPQPGESKAETKARVARERALAWYRLLSSEAKAATRPKRNAASRAYAVRNPEKRSAANKSWAERNPDALEAIRARRRKCPINRMNSAIRSRIALALVGRQKSAPTFAMLGYSKNDLTLHIEACFSAGMSWGNYGQWHIDHIRPVASFSFDDFESDVRECWALSNLRPLWGHENMKKSSAWQGKKWSRGRIVGDAYTDHVMADKGKIAVSGTITFA